MIVLSRDYQKALFPSLKILHTKFQLKIFSIQVCRFADSKQSYSIFAASTSPNSMRFATSQASNSTTILYI